MATMTVGRKKLGGVLSTCTLDELAQRLRRHDPNCNASGAALCLIRSGERLPTLRLANALALVLEISCFEWFQAAEVT